MQLSKNDAHGNYMTRLFKISAILAFTLINTLFIDAQENRLNTIPIDSVVIRARTESRNLMEKPYTEPASLVSSISKLTASDIARTGSTNIVEAMNYIPGALIETRGRQVKQFFSVRGQKYPYPDYAINGVWQKEFEELPYFFSASDIQEIEIVRSSAALLTGLSGLTGLVNIKTKEYTSPETRLEMEYGSYNTIHTHLSNGNKIGNFSYAAGLGYDKTAGPAGKHAREEMSNLYTQLGWQPSQKLSVKANLFVLNGERQMRIAELPADKRYRDMVQNFDPVSAILTNVKTVYRPNAKLSTELQLFYSYRNPTFHDEVKQTSSNEKDYEYGLNFIQSVAVSPLNTLRFGGLYNRWIAPNGKRFYTGKKCDTETYSAVVVDEQRFGALTLDGGLRWTKTYMNDYGAFNIEGDGAQFKNVNPIKDEWEPALMQGSLGASYRAGNLFSVYFNSAAGQVKPRQGALDINLTEPLNESRYKFDIGLVRSFMNSGKMSVTVFKVIQKDAIALSGQTFVDTELNITRELYINRDQEQSGVEFEISGANMPRTVQPFMNFTVMKSFRDEEGTMIRDKENPGFIFSGGAFMNKNSFDLNILAKYVSAFENERFASVTAGPQPLGDFMTIDFTAGYTSKGKVPVRFYVKSRNIADNHYSTVTGYPDFGRMIFAGIQLKFTDFK
jgi:iron complex outermembrane receptor protein